MLHGESTIAFSMPLAEHNSTCYWCPDPSSQLDLERKQTKGAGGGGGGREMLFYSLSEVYQI